MSLTFDSTMPCTSVTLCAIRKLYEDSEGGVFSVTLFKRAVCAFKAKAQESR